MQDEDDIDYRNLLAASSEEDLVLFEKDLWTGRSSVSAELEAHVKFSKQSENLFNWSDKLVLNVKSLFQSRKQRQHPPEDEINEEQNEVSDHPDQPPSAGVDLPINNQKGKNQNQTIWSNAQAGIGKLWSSANPSTRQRTNKGCTSLLSTNDETADYTSDRGECTHVASQQNCTDTVQSLNTNGGSWPIRNVDTRSRVDSNTSGNSLEGDETADDMPGNNYSYTAMDDSQTGESEKDPLFGGNRKADVYYKGQVPWRRRILAIMLLILILAGAIGTGVALGVIYSRDESEPSEPNGYVYREAAVAADAARCSEIGRDMLLNEGSAIDAAIAGLLCVGLYNAHSAGIGGGSFIMYYDKDTATPSFLNAREVAPMAASRDMFQNESADASTTGGLAIGVPGEIMGYWEAHQRFGKLPWGDLFQPSIDLAENGFRVGPALARAIDQNSNLALTDPSLSEIMLDEDGNVLKENDTMYRRKLAQTMRSIAEGGAEAFYNGSMAATIAEEIAERDGIVTAEDLAQYQVAVKAALSIDINDFKAYTGPPPCSGAVYALIINILEGYGFSPESLQSIGDETLTYHRIIEAFKFAYAKRSALGDADYVDVEGLVANLTSQDYADGIRSRITDDRTHDTDYYEPSFQIMEDSGTAHISVVDQLGNAASITSTVNTYFGSKVRGRDTGIIYNNEMDDFSKPGAPNFFGVPPSPSNFIEPGKRPLSSMTPVIMVDGDGEVKLVVGASGGTRITTATSLITMETLWFGSSLRDGVERRRIHNQLIPNATSYEPGFSQEVVNGLIQKEQEMQESTGIAVVQVINRQEDGRLEAYCDSRKDGIPSGF